MCTTQVQKTHGIQNQALLQSNYAIIKNGLNDENSIFIIKSHTTLTSL